MTFMVSYDIRHILLDNNIQDCRNIAKVSYTQVQVTMEEVELLAVRPGKESGEDYQNLASGVYVDGFTPKPQDLAALDVRSSSEASLEAGENLYNEPDYIPPSTIKTSEKKPPQQRASLEVDDESYLIPNPRHIKSRTGVKTGGVEKKGGTQPRNASEQDPSTEEGPALPESGRSNRHEDYSHLDVKRHDEENAYTALREAPAKLPKIIWRWMTANSVVVFCSIVICLTLCSLLYLYVKGIETKYTTENQVLRQETQVLQQENQELKQETQELKQETQDLRNEMVELRRLINGE